MAGLILGASLVACDDGKGGAEAAAKQYAAAVSAGGGGARGGVGTDTRVGKQRGADL